MLEVSEATLGSGKSKAAIELADQLLGGAGSTGTRTATATKGAANVGHAIALRPSGSPPPPPPPATVPTAPLSLVATGGSSKVTLSWAHPTSDGGSSITNYVIWRGTTSGGETVLTTVGDVTSWVDTGVTNGTRYFYKVAASNSVGTGPTSTEASATPAAATLPTEPRNLTAVPAKPRGVSLSWTAPASDGGSAITGYQIYRGTSPGGEAFLVSVGTGTSYKDTTAVGGLTYYYMVVAVNALGASPPSNEAFAIAR